MMSSPNGSAQSGMTALPLAIGWIEQLLVGRVGTVIAVLAIAWVGLSLLQGRLAIRDGIRVVLGCFILFGAPLLAHGFMAFVAGNGQAVITPVSPPPAAISLPSKPPQFDPYAGASVPN